MLAIDAQNVTKRFGEGKKKNVAIADLCLQVKPNQIFGLLGSNGAGKTTLLSMLGTTLLPTEGKLRIYGKDVVKQNIEVRKIIGICSGYSGLFDDLTIRENLFYYATLRRLKNIDGYIDELLEIVDLTDKQKVLCRDLSTGMRQRVSIAIALVGRPKLLLLDEPTAGLDPVIAAKIRKSIAKIQKELGMTIILTTHNMYEAEQLCDNVALLKDGKILTVKTVKGLRKMLGGYQIVELETEKKIRNFRSNGVKSIDKHNGKTTIKMIDVEKNLMPALKKLEKYRIKNIAVRELTMEELYLAYVK